MPTTSEAPSSPSSSWLGVAHCAELRASGRKAASADERWLRRSPTLTSSMHALRRRWAATAAAASLLATACGGDDENAPAQSTSAHTTSDAGPLCAADEIALPGGCLRAGVPADGCAPGFVSDGASGCAAMLPAQACPAGSMAIPGESECHEIAPCGAAPWGDIPVEGDTVYVDAAAAPGGDGTAAQPFASLQDGVDAAPAGVLVAVAEGTYEAISVSSPVRIWGRCPALVEIAAKTGELAAVDARTGVAGSELHDLAVTGKAVGVAVTGSEEVTLERVWIHDTTNRGLNLQDDLGPTSLLLRRSLVERTRVLGAFVSGATLRVEESLIRDVSSAGGKDGAGLALQASSPDAPGTLDVSRSVFEGVHGIGLLIQGSNATLDATMVRDTQAGVSSGGIGLAIQSDGGRGSTVKLTGSVIERNGDVAVLVLGSELAVERSVVRDTRPIPASGLAGEGITVQYDPTTLAPSTATITDSLVASNKSTGVAVLAATALIERVVVRGTEARESDGMLGFGIEVDDQPQASPASATIRSCLVEDNRATGIGVRGGTVTIEDVLVRRTRPHLATMLFGRGINVQPDDSTQAPAKVSVSGSLVEDNLDVGIFALSSALTIDRTTVRGTKPATDGIQGDGVMALLGGSIALTASRVETSSRAGVTSFGGHVSVGATTLECNPIPLDGETFEGAPPTFEDLGANVCGCGGHTGACKVVTSDLTPPGSLP